MKKNKKTIGFFVFLHLGALLALLPSTFCWSAVSLMLFMYWLTASVGICLGFHRYLTHRSMMMPRWLNYFVVFCGTLACQNGPLKWVAQHRMHHQGTDTRDDPHDASQGFLWSHIGWMFYDRHKFDNETRLRKYTKDINNNKFYQFLDKHFIDIQVQLGIIFYLIGGISWVVWGIFVRLVLVYHITWLVNSACHMFGYTNYKIKGDNSTNCWWSALLSFGEGWHNNHHYNAKRYTTKVNWYELDATGLLIWSLSKLGIIKILKY